MQFQEIIDEFSNREDFTSVLDDEQTEKYSLMSPGEQVGFNELARYVYIRRLINENLTLPDRREFEASIRERISDENASLGYLEWQELCLLHHCSVTADQAELSAKALL